MLIVQPSAKENYPRLKLKEAATLSCVLIYAVHTLVLCWCSTLRLRQTDSLRQAYVVMSTSLQAIYMLFHVHAIMHGQIYT